MPHKLTSADRIEGSLDFLSKSCPAYCTVALATFGWQLRERYVVNAVPTLVEQPGRLLLRCIALLGPLGIHAQIYLSVTLFRETRRPRVSGLPRFFIDVVLAGFGVAMLVAPASIT